MVTRAVVWAMVWAVLVQVAGSWAAQVPRWCQSVETPPVSSTSLQHTSCNNTTILTSDSELHSGDTTADLSW